MTNPQTRPLEMRITGLGGQGVVLAAHIIGRAVIDAGRHATMIQSFGPEARGSSCSATLIASESEVLYPYVDRTDVFVAMSGDGYSKYRHEMRKDAVLIYEQDLVHPEGENRRTFAIPSTRIAESLGRSLVQNIVMVGFVGAVIGLVPMEVMRNAVRRSVPSGTEDLNLKAFDLGVHHFESLVGAEVAV